MSSPASPQDASAAPHADSPRDERILLEVASKTTGAPGDPAKQQTVRTDAMTQAEVDAAMESIPAVRRRGPFYALTFRNFRLFFVGQLISVAGTWMQTVAQNWLVWDVTHQARWLGIVSGASALPYVTFAMWGGNVADRYSRRTILVCTQTIAMLLAFLLALLATNRWVPLQAWHIAALAGMLGVVNAFNMPAQQAFVTDMVDEREAMSNAIALNSFRFNIARFLGPILAGAVLTKYGAPTCFNLNGISYIAVILSLLMMRLPKFEPKFRKLNILEGVVYIWQTASILRVVALVGTSSMFAWSVSTLYPMISTHFGRAEAGYSTIMALQGIGAALGAAFLATIGENIERRTLVYGGVFAFCIFLIALALAPTFLLALIFLGISGFAMIVFGMSAQIRVQMEVPDALRGRVLAVYSLVFQGLMPLGGLEMGFLAQQLHGRSLLWIPHAGAQIAIGLNAACCLLIAVALFLWSQVDRRRMQPRSS